jgi:hypothetical protein
VDVRQPRHVPVRRERQHALGRRYTFDLAVQADHAVARKRQLAFEHLHARAEFNQRDGAKYFLRVFRQATLEHRGHLD